MVKGFQQQYGIDYDQTYASVEKPMAFRALLDAFSYGIEGIIKPLVDVKLALHG